MLVSHVGDDDDNDEEDEELKEEAPIVHLTTVHVSHKQLENARLHVPHEYHRVLGSLF